LKRTSKNVKNGKKQPNFDVFLSFLMDNLLQYDVWTTLQSFTIVFHQMIREIHDCCGHLTGYNQL
jgi:hypothetical protein